MGLLSIGSRRDLKARIAELSEEIEELHTEEKTLIQAFGKEDAAGMKQVKDEIHAAEANRENLDRQENSLSDSIRMEQERFDALSEQAADLDRGELTSARLALRRDSERQAWERIRESVSSGKVSFQRFRSSVKETDRMLGENGAEGQEIKREPERKGRIGDEQGL
jgi:predicted nuclease with TOPRIM domain